MDHTTANWTPSDYLPALQRLSQLQDQLTSLRTVLPSTLHPLHTATVSPSPETFYAHFAASATAARASVQSFRAAWEDEETARVLGRVRESLTDNAGAPAPGGRWWDERVDLDMGMDGGMDGVAERVAGTGGERMEEKGTAAEEVEGVVRAFQARWSDGVVGYRAPAEGIKVILPARSRGLVFEVQRVEINPGEMADFKVICNGTTRLHEAITSSLERRPHKRDLGYTLDTIAAFANIGTAKCDKCHRALDSSAMLPTVRRRRPGEDEWDLAHPEWEALHEGCV